MKTKVLVLLCAFVSNASFAQVHYERIILGEGFATDINNRGQIVGYDVGSWLWENGVFTELQFPGYSHSPVAINNSGQILARTVYSLGGDHGLLWKDGIVTDLGYDACGVLDINDQGSIVGSFGSTVESMDPDGSFVIEHATLRTLDWPYSNYDIAWGINNQGQVVGGDGYSAFLWEDGNFTILPGFDKYNMYKKTAYNINDSERIVGYAYLGSEFGSDFHACFWEKDDSEKYQIHDLGDFEDTNTFACDINNYGQIIGNSNNLHALTWIDGEVIDLGRGYVRAINDSGWIVGDYGGIATLWKPVPEPGTVLLLMIGAIFLRPIKQIGV